MITSSQPEGVDDHVAFAAIAPFAGVIPARVGTDGVGAGDRLGVDDARRRHRVAAHGVAQPVAQRIVDVVDGAVVTPAFEVPVHGLPRWEVVRQLPPRTAGAQHVEDGVDDLAAGVFLRDGRRQTVAATAARSAATAQRSHPTGSGHGQDLGKQPWHLILTGM